MSIFQRKHKQPQPIINNPYGEDTVAMPVPVTTVMPAVKPVVVEVAVQQCAACGIIGATQQLSVSYFGYVTLQYVYLCIGCKKRCVDGHTEHNAQLRRRYIAAKETIEMVTV